MHHPVRLAAALCVALAVPWQVAAQPGNEYKTWYLAEGATGPFEEDILIGNPNSVTANISVTFYKDDGTSLPVIAMTVPATSRKTIRVNDLPGLATAFVSARITSDVDIVVERSMYWLNRRGGHNAQGVNAPATRWYFAEGATQRFFNQFLLVANPSPTDTAEIGFSFLTAQGGRETTTMSVPPMQRRTLWVDLDLTAQGMDTRAFSSVVESTNAVPILAERAMYWSNFSGGTNSTGVTGTSTTWRFAEGMTAGGFDTYVLLGNPGDEATDATVTWYLEDGTTYTTTRTIAAEQRVTIWANYDLDVPSRVRAGAPFSFSVESTRPIIAERAMYWRAMYDGHTSAGVTDAATAWGFAEGVEDGVGGKSYDTWYLFVNGTNTAAQIEATFYREDGTGVVRTFEIGPNSRYTLSPSVYLELTNQRFAAFFRSTNAVPFVAERAVYWDNYGGGHGSFGVPYEGRTIAAPPAPPAHTVTGVTPAGGSTNGDTRVTVTGTNFATGSWVLFGGTPATAVSIVDSTTIVAWTPGHAAGAVAVQVNSPIAPAVSLPNAFTYEAPPPPPPPPPPPTSGTVARGAPARIYCDAFDGRGVCTHVVQWPGPDGYGVISQLARERGDLLYNSCREHGGNNEFMFEAVRRLRQATGSNRWGMNIKRGNQGLSQDIVTYFYGPEGTEMEGDIRVYIIDIISGHCGDRPGPNWDDVTDKTRVGGTIGRWTTAGLEF